MNALIYNIIYVTKPVDILFTNVADHFVLTNQYYQCAGKHKDDVTL